MNELGDLRPSQLIYTFGVGSLLDLPNMSALIMGLDDWDTRYCEEIAEDRLLGAIRRRLGNQVQKLYLPPMVFDDDSRDPTAPAIGVPVSVFPRWLRCPLCDVMATVDSGVFQLVQDQWRPDQTRYVHANCGRQGNVSPTAYAVRFLLACREGHLTDFPWVEYVHSGKVPCKPSRLTLREYGAAGDASDIVVKCVSCGEERRMGDAFDEERFSIGCSGHHPHLRRSEAVECKEKAKTILLGASNSWFPLVMSALSLPPSNCDKLNLLIDEHWKELKDMPSLEVVRYNTAPSRMPDLADFSAEAIWDGIQARKAVDSENKVVETDLKIAEWQILSGSTPATPTKDFKTKRVPPPLGFESLFEETVLLERMREVRALLAFNRIESKGDFADASQTDDDRQTPLCRQSPTWLPSSEVRGEGIFIRFKEDALQSWEQRQDVKNLEKEYYASHVAWRKMRNQNPPEAGFLGIRFVLIHSLSHALMRQIGLECGYTAASVRERLYCRTVGQDHGPMAGVLIYTAASDSEGTLGGLVELGNPISMGRQLQSAFETLRICGSDPLCSEHSPADDGRGIHGACCHACLFAPETSCEKGNRYLDRTVLVRTFSDKSVEFFNGY